LTGDAPIGPTLADGRAGGGTAKVAAMSVYTPKFSDESEPQVRDSIGVIEPDSGTRCASEMTPSPLGESHGASNARLR
jgi:hypothetical protein